MSDENSIMADLRAASAEVSAREAPEPAAPSTPAPTPAASSPAPSATPEASGRPRDEAGRFAPKAAQQPGEAPPAAPTEPGADTPEGQQEAQPAAEKQSSPAPAHKAPQSWRPAVREKWSALPPEVQEEVSRVERETQRVLRESAESKRMADAFAQTIAPYRALLTGPPLQVVGSLLQTAAQLQTAPPAHRGALVAQIIKGYNVPLEAIDAALGGEQPTASAQSQQPAEFRDPRFDQFLQTLEQAKQQKHTSEIDTFAASHEFFDDVRDTMADLLEVAGRRGVALSMEDAYNRAVMMHPDIAEVVQQRKAAQAATVPRAATQQALAAASSVKSEPAPGIAPPSGSGSVLDDVRAAAASARRVGSR